MNSAACSPPSDNSIFFLLHPKGCRLCSKSNTKYTCTGCQSKRNVQKLLLCAVVPSSTIHIFRRKTMSYNTLNIESFNRMGMGIRNQSI